MATSGNRFPSQIWHQEGPKRNGSPVEAFERGGAKKDFRKHREQLQKTGGPAPPKLPELSLIIKEISPTTFMQIQNAYDDDAIIARNNETGSVMTFLAGGARGERQI